MIMSVYSALREMEKFPADKFPNKDYTVLLPPEEIPTAWYNIQADLPEPMPPWLHPVTKEPIPPQALEAVWTKEAVRHEFSTERWIKIPDPVLELYRQLPRPTPLKRCRRLEEYLNTPAQIYQKCEYVNPFGSHKANGTAPEAYYAWVEGYKGITTEAGAAQWSSTFAYHCKVFNLRLLVFMARVSYYKKPGRRIVMELEGAEVYPSPSDKTEFGRKILKEYPEHPGSLGIAVGECLEVVLKEPDYWRYSLGSVANHILMYQTVVGLEAKKALESIDVYPDYVVGCIGGGSNYFGLMAPFMMDKLRGAKPETEFHAVEPHAVPHTTKGKYTYDFGDTAKTTPLLPMLTLGADYVPPPDHAGGLRYHGMAPLISYLIVKGYMKSFAYRQPEVFEAARIVAQTEGMITAPETAHAWKHVIELALECKRKGEKKVILVNNCGHGLLDLAGYDEFLKGTLPDSEPTEFKYPSYVTEDPFVIRDRSLKK